MATILSFLIYSVQQAGIMGEKFTDFEIRQGTMLIRVHLSRHLKMVIKLDNVL